MKFSCGASNGGRAGFTLIEIIIAVAIVAVMAGAVTPLAFKELVRAREEATLKELAGIESGLLRFYEDTGRFPSEAEGLTALVADPGVTGWQGPYVDTDRGDPVSAVTTDAFGDTYVYDLDPATIPAGAANLIVASGGSDHNLTFGSLGGTWTINSEGDDLVQLVTNGPVNRDKILTSRQEMALIGEAAARYYQDHISFPAGSGDLTGDYLDPGMDGDAFIDSWNQSYVLQEDGNTPPTLTIKSMGPNRTDDGGGDDDLVLAVSSIPPGREVTLDRLDIAQAALTADQGLSLTGDWPTDRQNLGLAGIYEQDGWGRTFVENTDSRAVFSPGPDGDPTTTDDNIPTGLGPAAGGGGGGNNGGGNGGGNNGGGNGGGNNGGGNGGGNNGNGNGNGGSNN